MSDTTISPAVQVVETFFEALQAAHWDVAAGMVDPDLAIEFRKSELASLIAWARNRDAIISMRQRGEGTVGWSSEGRVDAALLDEYGATPLHGVPGGVQTLAELAAMSPRAFIATCLEASNGPILTPDGDRIDMTRRVIGGVSEGDVIVHVLFRVGGSGVQHTDPLSVEVLRLKGSGHAWNIDPTTLRFGIASIHSFTTLADLGLEQATSGVKPHALEA